MTSLQTTYWHAIRCVLRNVDEDIIPTVENIVPLAQAMLAGGPALTLEWVVKDYESNWSDQRRGYSLTNRPSEEWETYVPIFVLDCDSDAEV